jgi:pimeloyl-ACP methyl ester carboxylesterase
VWLTGNAMRLLERTHPGVLYTDLAACNAYAGALAAAAKLDCPVLAIVGARDIMAPTKNTRNLIGALREASVVELPECGHSMMAEQPNAVLDALRAFV